MTATYTAIDLEQARWRMTNQSDGPLHGGQVRTGFRCRPPCGSAVARHRGLGWDRAVRLRRLLWWGRLGLVGLVLQWTAWPAWAKPWAGLVLHVSDGDTVWVQPAQGGEARKLRLAAIDAPERCQMWGPQAWHALHTRLQGQPVQVVSGRLDTYGRLLAQVWHQGQDVGAWMVAQGHAWSPYFRGMPGPYDQLQREAQWARRGLFAHPLGLMPPREFRRWHGSC